MLSGKMRRKNLKTTIQTLWVKAMQRPTCAASGKQCLSASPTEIAMKKLKNENALFKEALLAGVKYAEGRGVVEFEATDSASEKLLYLYRLLVHDKVIQPLPEDQVAEKSMRHKLAIWYSKQLPKDHPLLK